MDTRSLEKKFLDMGARVKVATKSRRGFGANNVRLDVINDDMGECFEIAVNPQANAEVSILNVQPDDRHLLLLVRNGETKSKFLCGHDERHWFVAAIPEAASVGTVSQAKESLKPKEVQVRQVGLKKKERNSRKNDAYIRQGEWFFVPTTLKEGKDFVVLKNEPITRGRGSKPHTCEFMHRTKGETVWVCNQYPNGVSVNKYNELIRTEAGKNMRWRQMMKDAVVYVKGTVKHADHKTICLDGWHRVYVNNEHLAKAMSQVAFLD